MKRELGEYLRLRKKYDEAIELLTESLSLREAYLSRLYSAKGQKESQIKTHRGFFILTLIHLGKAYHGAGRLEQAMEQYQRALSSIKEWGLKTNLDALLYTSMGKLYGQLKKYPQALQILKKALALHERRRSAGQAAIATSRQIAHILHETGKHSEAIPYYGRAVRIIESTRSLLESDYRQSYFGEKVGAYVGMVGALLEVGKPAEAFSYNERARSRLFLDLLGSKVELSKAKGDLREEGRALNEQIGAIKAKLARKVHRRALRKELKQTRKAYNAFLVKVKEVDREQVSLMTVEPFTLREVQNLLDPGTTLIEYFVTDSKVHAWIVEKNKAQYEGVKLTREMLTNLVKTLREKITNIEGIEKFNEVSSEIYQALIQPVLPYVNGRRLIIVPHDVLHYLPFQALISSSGRYLIEDYSIHYLSSASLMKFTTAKRRQVKGEKILVIGNPKLEVSKVGLKFAELEAKEIQKLYPQSTVLLKKAATEEAVKSRSARHDILHFAAHVELNEKDPLSTALLLAKDGKDDGRLTVKEIFEMELNADLVVLSGCETGLGKLSRGDEFVGLTRAFIYAGTPSVVASLWKVEDSSTAALMGSFYKNLKTMSKSEALRQAQLELIRGKVGADLLAMRGVGGITKGGKAPRVESSSSVSSSVSTAHPYFWAPFVLVGDGK
ncbi:MAG: CHAT domain-containing protein [Deltaproteobacteria bacterium]|nr:CHAT domain-containing protein [Deltaproteobacteria bacterium]